MQKVRKAVIPAAGLGTRVLPATKAMPKEMFPIVDKPAIQYIVEEAAASGIEEILIITNRGKGLIEDHFDYAPELESRLSGNPDKKDLLDSAIHTAKIANVYFVRQKETKGLGHAIHCAKDFIGNEPFAILYGDDVIMSETPVVSQLIKAYEQFGKGAVGVKEVSKELVAQYCSLKLDHLSNNLYNCTDMIEKPKPGEEFSLFSILGRCVLPPEIFDILAETKPGAGGEIQLTDAMKVLAQTTGVTAVDFEGTRYDMGSKLGIMQANVETALKHGQIGADFKKYIKELAKNL